MSLTAFGNARDKRKRKGTPFAATQKIVGSLQFTKLHNTPILLEENKGSGSHDSDCGDYMIRT